MFSADFWKKATERALKSAAQALVGLFLIGETVFNIFTVDPGQAAGIAIGAGVLSYLTSIVSAPVGDEEVKGEPSLV